MAFLLRNIRILSKSDYKDTYQIKLWNGCELAVKITYFQVIVPFNI